MINGSDEQVDKLVVGMDFGMFDSQSVTTHTCVLCKRVYTDKNKPKVCSCRNNTNYSTVV